MKLKIIALLLGVFLLTGCGQSNPQTTPENALSPNPSQTAQNTSEQATDSQAESEPYVLTFEAQTIEGETMTSDIFADSKLTMINVWVTKLLQKI